MKASNKSLPLVVALALLCAGAAAHAAPGKRAPRAAKPGAKAMKPAPPKPLRPGPAWSVAFSPDGARIAVGGYKRVTLYDAADGAKRATWPVPSDAVRSLAFSADGKYLAAGTGVPAKSGGVIVYDAATGKPVRSVSGHNDTVESVAWAGGLLLSAANDEKVRLTDVASGKTVGVLSEHVGRCLSVAVPAAAGEQDGGEIFATGGADNVVKVWDAKTRRVVVNFDQCQSPVWCLATLPQPGRFVAGSADGRVRVFGVRADPDGKQGDGQRTGFVARTLSGHEGSVYAVAVSPDGKRIVSGGADRKVIVWGEGTDKKHEMTEATGDIFGLAVSPDNRLVAAASFDGKTRVYTLADGKLVLELPGGAPPLDPPVQTASP